ncbi:APC family permease [Nocardioides sp. KR10-350]|uniref:APC family permease n=1 Tax=Nocardioides cheoyonin TaxID=3156615 RepID=UPI0032B4600A
MSTSPLSTPAAEGSSPSNTELKRNLGIVGLLFASVGSIIGSGWLFGALNAAATTGPSAILSWIVGGVMVSFIGLVFAELGSMFPIAGGVVRFPHLAFGSFASYTAGWSTWVAASTTAPIEVEGALQYATRYADFTEAHKGGTVHTLTPLGFVVAIVLMAVFVVINYIGISWFARINNVLVSWKLVMIVLVILAFLFTSFHGSNLHSEGFFTHGAQGVFSAVATSGIVFSFLGFRQAIELAGEGAKPKRDIPMAVLGSILVTGILYVGLQIAFLVALDPGKLAQNGWDNVGNVLTNSAGPLASVASAIGLGWLAVLLYIDAIISPGDTGLIYTTTTARMSYAMGRNGNAPRALTRTTLSGAPWVSLVVAFIVGIIAFLPFPSWQQLVGFITSATVLSFGPGPLAVGALRRRIPEHERPFRVPGGDLIPILGFASSNLIIYWTGWNTDWKLFVAILLGYALFAIHELISAETPPLELPSGAVWVIPWLAGLAIMSYVGDFDGGQGWVGFWTSIIILVAFSVVIYYLGVRNALSREQIERHIAEAEEESVEEAAALGGTH